MTLSLQHLLCYRHKAEIVLLNTVLGDQAITQIAHI